jgi:hypothetical protein
MTPVENREETIMTRTLYGKVWGKIIKPDEDLCL